MFQNFFTWLKGLGDELWSGAKAIAQQVAPQVLSDFDALVQKYAPLALQQAQAAETQYVSGAEKASFVKTQLSQQLQSDGIGIEKDGFDAFLNLLVEIGAAGVKLVTGKMLVASGASAPAATETGGTG